MRVALWRREGRGSCSKGRRCSLALLVHQGGDLLRDQTHHEDHHAAGVEQRAHVGETAEVNEGMEIPEAAKQKHSGRNRREQFQRRVQRPDLEDDQQEADSVLQRTDVALSDSPCGMDRFVGHRVSRAEEGHGAGCRVGEAVRQQIEEFAEFLAAYCAESGGQVFHLVARHVAREPVVEAVCEATAEARLGACLACADDHVVAFVEAGQQGRDVGRVVLAVGVHEDDHVAARRADSRLDGCSISF